MEALKKGTSSEEPSPYSTRMPNRSFEIIVEQFPGSEISGVGNSREFPGIPTPGGNSRESGRSGGSRAGAASPNPDKHFQWDWRVLGYLRTVRHAPGASAWPDPAHSTKRVYRVHCKSVTGGFCLFSQVSLPGSEKSDPGIPESSREFPLREFPLSLPALL